MSQPTASGEHKHNQPCRFALLARDDRPLQLQPQREALPLPVITPDDLFFSVLIEIHKPHLNLVLNQILIMCRTSHVAGVVGGEGFMRPFSP